MGRMKPAWYYKKQAQEAEARENYFQNRVPPDDATVTSRGASTDVYYRSIFLKSGTDHQVIKLGVPDATLQLISATDAGLLTTQPANQSILSLRGSGIKPSRIHWYRGTANATRKKTAWNTSWTKYYDNAGGRSHYSIPISIPTSAILVEEIQEKFESLFGPSGTKKALLGPQNGRAYLDFERVAISANS